MNMSIEFSQPMRKFVFLIGLFLMCMLKHASATVNNLAFVYPNRPMEWYVTWTDDISQEHKLSIRDNSLRVSYHLVLPTGQLSFLIDRTSEQTFFKDPSTPFPGMNPSSQYIIQVCTPPTIFIDMSPGGDVVERIAAVGILCTV